MAVPLVGQQADPQPTHLWTTDYARLLWGDTKAVLGAPLHWDKGDWTIAGIAATTVGGAAFFDQRIRDSVQAHRTISEDKFMKHFQNIGASWALVAMGGFEVWGEVGHNDKAKRVAMDAITADLIGPVLIISSVKYTVWRARPYANQGPFEFKPFGRDNQSFPSGHTATAFSLCTVLAEHYPAWWVQVLCYGSAATVGYARIEQNAHFTSDVIAGGFVGWSVARAVVHRHDRLLKPNKLTWVPVANGSRVGVLCYKSF